MIGTAHAVTPTDSRQPARAVQHPANVASRQHSAQVLDLALQIADAEVQAIVECNTACELAGGHYWCDTSKVAPDMQAHQEDREFAQATTQRALRYIGLRSPDAFPWRFVRHPDRPELVRFLGKP